MWRRAERPAVLALLLAVLLGGPAAGARTAVGDAFPPLAPALAGDPPPATAGKVVLVDFWASWCAPCRASFPAYARLNAAFAGRGLVIIAVGVDLDPGAYRAFVRRFQPPFYVARDRDQRLVAAVMIPTMPTSYLVDRAGRIRYLHPGFRGAATEAELRREIETLLAEPAS